MVMGMPATVRAILKYARFTAGALPDSAQRAALAGADIQAFNGQMAGSMFSGFHGFVLETGYSPPWSLGLDCGTMIETCFDFHRLTFIRSLFLS